MVYLGDGWGEVVLPSPGSEPPPPYSPPRVPHHHHQHFFPEAFASSTSPHHLHHHHHHPSSHHYCHNHISDYYDLASTRSSQPSSLTHSTNGNHHPQDVLLDSKSINDPPPPYPPTPFKSTHHPALNHGPSSAFSPPTKSIKYSYPPPYTLKDTNKNGCLVASQGKAPLSSVGVNIAAPLHHPHPPPSHPSDMGNSNDGVGSNSRGVGHNTATDPRNRTRRSHYPQDKTRSLEYHRVNGNGGESRSSSGSRGHHQVPSHRERIGSTNGPRGPAVTNGHPKGPLLKTGKSLELPHERLSSSSSSSSSYHHPTQSSSNSSSTRNNHHLHPHYPHHSSSHAHHRIPPTAHVHPGHSSHHHPTKDVHLQQTKEPLGNFSKSNKLAYVGIMPSKPSHSKRMRERDVRAACGQGRDYQRPCGRLKEQHQPIDPRIFRNDDRWARRTSKLEAAAAQSMMPVRAVPVTAITGQSPGVNVASSTARQDVVREAEASLGRGRLRSCRSLDELSDLLDEEVPRLPVATTRSLDDLTEPLYENLDVINAHARNIHNARLAHNTSVPDLLEPPPRPPRQRNNSLSSLLDDLAQCGANTTLTRRALNTSVPDVLERGLGGRGMGVLSWSSPSSTLQSGASLTLRSNASNTSTLRSAATQEADNTSDIGVQLQKIREVARVLGVKYRNGELSSSSGSSSGAPSTHTSPRMPSHAHGALPMQAPGVPARAPVIQDVLREGRKSSPQQPDADVASQESGYSSMDSRSCRQLQQQQQHQNHFLQPTSLNHPSLLQYSPERMDRSPKHHVNQQHMQPFSLQDINRHDVQYTKSHSLDYYLDRPSERSPQHPERSPQHPAHNNYSKNPQYPSKQPHEDYYHKQPMQSSPDQTQSESKASESRHGYPGWNTGTLRHQSQQQSSSSRQQAPSSHQVPTQVILGQQTQQGVNQDKLGIYIKSVVPGGAADQDGRLQAGDQLLTVDGKSLIGITQERAAEYMMETGPVVTLEVARQGGFYHGLATILSQPSPQTNRGYPGGRHLSERDLPSKVLREHNQEPPTHPHQAPRMQSSKSVPSLNSDGGSSVVGGKAASLEVFNPSYSRTSSNTSLSQPSSSHVSSQHQHQQLQQQQQHQQQQQQQQQQPPIRSRSIQNLSDGSYQGAVGRHPSNPSLVVEEERYYQNVNFHQGAQDPRMGSTRTRPAQPLPLGSPASQVPPEQVRPDQFRPDPRSDHRPASAFMQREDMMPHRNELHRPASQRDIRADAKMMEMTEEVRRREDRMRLNGHAPNTQQQRPGPPQPHHRVPNAAYPFSPEGYGSPQGFPGQQHPGYHPAAAQPHSPQTPLPGVQAPPQQAHSQQYPGQPPHGFPGKHPPPTAPKPKSQGMSQTPLSPEAPEKPSRQYGYEGIVAGYDGPPRPPPPEDGYRDSPPPPPPPTSTHPLLQTSRPTSSVGYNSNQMPNKSPFNTSSPWDREEKDRNDRRRREAVRHWRDEQITSLEGLEMRTSQQDERLRTLRLEKEFQRRAEEALTNDDDDEDDDDEDDDDEVNELESKESSRQIPDPVIREDIKPPSSAPIIPMGQEPRMNGGGPVDDERARRVDEIRRKQQELEAASEVEERLLREAQRRQQEEQMRQRQQQAPPPQHQHYQHQHQHHATQRLDTLVATPFQPQYSNGPVNGMRGGGGSHNTYQEHGVAPESRGRIDAPVSASQHSPVPPERGSSYSIMQQTTPSSTSSNSRYKGTDASSSATIKRVQFSEAPATVETHITYDSNANQEKTPNQDPDNFINEAETLLNSSPTRSVSGTPGVIGAQEVYRDPRMRRLQQKQAEQAAAKNPGPEKLTFKEKMKMFAMETGEGESPKDKVKISRAQRDIEH